MNADRATQIWPTHKHIINQIIPSSTTMSSFELLVTARRADPYNWLVTFRCGTLCPTFEHILKPDSNLQDELAKIITRVYHIRLQISEGLDVQPSRCH